MESLIIKNKKAFFNYEILDKYEAGIMLAGSEVKSLRQKKVLMSDSYAVIRQNEAWLLNCSISLYEQANRQNHTEKRERKLLLNRKEIDKIAHKLKAGNLTLVPLSLYWRKNKVKVEIGLCKGKKSHDKRQDEKKKEAKRDIDRALKKY